MNDTTNVSCYHCHQQTLEVFGRSFVQQCRCLNCGAGCEILNGSVYVPQSSGDEFEADGASLRAVVNECVEMNSEDKS